MSDAIVHIAGHPVQVGSHLRQRCSWCGGILVDEDLSRIAFEIRDGDDKAQEYPTWPTGALVEVNGLDDSVVTMTRALEHDDGDPVPDGCCAKLGPEITR